MRCWMLVMLTACGGVFIDVTDEPPTPMARACDAVVSETTAHFTVVRTLTSLDDLQGEIVRHQTRMDRVFEQIQTAINASECQDEAARADADRTMAYLRAREASHAEALRESGDLAAATVECAGYRDEIDGVVEALEDRWLVACGP